MNQELSDIRKRVQEKEEIVRKLKLVSIHKEKHDANELEEMTSRWSEACVNALQELHEALNGQISMEDLLKSLNIDNQLVGYHSEDDTFSLETKK